MADSYVGYPLDECIGLIWNDPVNSTDHRVVLRIAALRWNMPRPIQDTPHEYILQQWGSGGFRLFREKLRTEAVRDEFTLRGKTYWYRYYYPGDGYRYWIIDYVLTDALLR